MSGKEERKRRIIAKGENGGKQRGERRVRGDLGREGMRIQEKSKKESIEEEYNRERNRKMKRKENMRKMYRDYVRVDSDQIKNIYIRYDFKISYILIT